MGIVNYGFSRIVEYGSESVESWNDIQVLEKRDKLIWRNYVGGMMKWE